MGREVLQVFLVGVKFRLVGIIQILMKPLYNTEYAAPSTSGEEQSHEPGSFPERGKIARH